MLDVVVADLTMFLFSRQEWLSKQRTHTLLVIRSFIAYLHTYLPVYVNDWNQGMCDIAETGLPYIKLFRFLKVSNY